MYVYVVQKLCPRSGRWLDQDYYQEDQLETAKALCKTIARVEGCATRVRDLRTESNVFYWAPLQGSG